VATRPRTATASRAWSKPPSRPASRSSRVFGRPPLFFQAPAWASPADDVCVSRIPGALEKDLNAIKAVYGQYKAQIYAVTVGSETLYRKDFNGEQLVNQINTVKNALPGVKVGTADSWNKFADGTADPVIPAVDIMLVNAFGFWQGQQINNASAQFFDDIMQAFGHIQEISGSTEGPELWVGETGWPGTGELLWIPR
jgi:exo-beta-1,3-glucanase (GH17 family)